MARRDAYEEGSDRNRSWLLFLLLLLLLIVLAYFAWRWWSPDRYRTAEAPPPIEEYTDPPVAVPAALEPETEPREDGGGAATAPSGDDAYQEPLPIVEPAPPAIPDPIELTVYFDLMKWSLTPEAMRVVDAAFADVDPSYVTRATVDGYTDTAGAEGYNVSLSNRRAFTVRRYLMDKGVGREFIDTRGHGETNLAQRTPDGVREPLNRRAEVEIRFD